MRETRLLILSLCLLAGMSLHAQKKPKKELYVPMDYSTCGYHASEEAIPDVGVAVYVAWQDGDCSSLIQAAIDQVGRQKPNAIVEPCFWARARSVSITPCALPNRA